MSSPFFRMDIRAEGLVALFERHRPEVVMHLAAQAAVKTSMENPAVDAAVHLMKAIRRPGSERRAPP